MGRTRKGLPHNRILIEIIEGAESDLSTRKLNKNINKNVPRITSDILIKGGNILPFLKKKKQRRRGPVHHKEKCGEKPNKEESRRG
jgi:hypothetical protein